MRPHDGAKGDTMFGKLRKKIESLAFSLKCTHDSLERLRDRYWELKGDHDRLVEALGMTKETTHKVEYIRKGGPEKP